MARLDPHGAPGENPTSIKIIVKRLVPSTLPLFQAAGPVSVKVTFGYVQAFKTKPAHLAPGHVESDESRPDVCLLQGVYFWGAAFQFPIADADAVIKVAVVDSTKSREKNKLGLCHLHLRPLLLSKRTNFVGSLPIVDLTDRVVGFLDTQVFLLGCPAQPFRATTAKLPSARSPVNVSPPRFPPSECRTDS